MTDLLIKKYKPEFIFKYRRHNINNNIKLYEIIVPIKKYQGQGGQGGHNKKTDDKWVKGQIHNQNQNQNQNQTQTQTQTQETITTRPNEVIKSGPSAWSSNRSFNKDDSKLIIGILNKLTVDNFEKMIKETSILNYKNEKIVDIIFTKSVSEKDFSELYAEYCKRLDFDNLINDLCLEQFTRKKNKNLCKFIGSLYKINLIKSIEPFINFLINNLNSENLEMLLVLIKTVGPKNPEFKEILINLNNIKETFNSNRLLILIENAIIDASH